MLPNRSPSPCDAPALVLASDMFRVRRYVRSGISATWRRAQSPPGRSELAETDPADAVVPALGEHQGGAAAGRQDVLAQVDLVDVGPDPQRRGTRLLVGQCG